MPLSEVKVRSTSLARSRVFAPQSGHGFGRVFSGGNSFKADAICSLPCLSSAEARDAPKHRMTAPNANDRVAGLEMREGVFLSMTSELQTDDSDEAA